jgi:type VI secretion system protein ImpF
MARVDHKTSIIPSVLDRLLDDAPGVSQEPASARAHSIRELEKVVARDLEALLNTRQETLEALPPEFAEVNRSLIAYGLPDFSAFSLDSDSDRNQVRRAVEHAIVTSEPRLDRVRVTLDLTRNHDRGLRFRIDALLRVEPAPEPVRFDAVLQLHTQQYVVKGQADG